jgi:hypothetical protein
LTGSRLVDVHPSGIVSHTPLTFPDSKRALPREKSSEMDMRAFVAALLRPVAASRLGAGTSGPNDIKTHPFFRGVNWNLT